MPRILIVDDAPVFLLVVNRLLTGRNYDTALAKNGEEALQILQSQTFDLMIADISMHPVNGMELLHRARKSYPQMGVIMLTADDTIDTALDAIKKGAFDYLIKPFKLNDLLQAVQHALEYHYAVTEHKPLGSRSEYREYAGKLPGIIAESPGMLRVCRMIERLSPSDITVFIYGEKGSGKTLVARDLHRYSLRKSRPFLAVNCATLPAAQMETELFGQIQAADADASTAKPGLFETARSGTLLLYEIGTMPLDIQSKFLRALQEKQICKVGGCNPIQIDVRIIAATSENLEPRVKQGTFSKDLYQHLHVIHIDIPPLRNRPEDLLPLVSQTLRQKLADEAEMPTLSLETEIILESYTWPGNVREFEEAIQHALSFAHDGVITKTMLPANIIAAVEAEAPDGVISSHCEQFKTRPLKTFLRDKEEELLQQIRAHLDKDKKTTRDTASRKRGIARLDKNKTAPDNTVSFEWL